MAKKKSAKAKPTQAAISPYLSAPISSLINMTLVLTTASAVLLALFIAKRFA